MAKKKYLQDSDGQIWPITVADCVYLSDGSKTIKKYIDDGLAGKANSSHGTHLTIGTGSSNAAAGNHTHSYAGSSSAGGAANSVKTNLIIKLNGGSTEGTNLFTFNGSTAKTINITPSAIGAAASSHGTHLTIGTGSGNAAAGNHTHSYLPLSGGTMSGTITSTNSVGLQCDTTMTQYSAGLGWLANDQISLRFSNSKLEGPSITAYDKKWSELNSTIYFGRGITTISPHDNGNMVSFRTKDNVGNVLSNPMIQPDNDGNWCLGSPTNQWKEIWIANYGIRCAYDGFVIAAKDSDAMTGRGGIWVNSSGLRPLSGDGKETCGQNGFRWAYVWCVNSSNTTSDRELKTNINRIDVSDVRIASNGEDSVDKKFYNFVKDELNFYSWDWKDDSLNKDVPANIGIMAQDIENTEVGKLIVIPPREEEIEKEGFDEEGNRVIVKETITTNYAINDRNMYMSLGIALKQAINEIESLKKETLSLLNELNELKKDRE